MKVTSYLNSISETTHLDFNNLDEVIIAPKVCSRYGKVKKEEIAELVRISKDQNKKVTLEWDVLKTEDDYHNVMKVMSDVDLNLFDAIRVQDPGIVQFIKENYKEQKIHLILENGNHNLVGIKRWCDVVGKQLERVVLSIELSKDKLTEYIKELKVEVEYLTLGRILLFYTPRNLVTPFIEDQESLKRVHTEGLEVSGSSEESPHKGFPIVENRHGTFMFHIKDQYILNHMDDLNETGLSHMRIDLRHQDLDLLNSTLKCIKENNLEDHKTNYPSGTTKGYFHVNKSDVIFKKLKNKKIQRKDENYLGEIVECSKSDFLVLSLKNKDISIKKGQRLKVINPEGRELDLPVVELKNTSLEDKEEIKYPDLALVNYMKRAWVKSAVYVEN